MKSVNIRTVAILGVLTVLGVVVATGLIRAQGIELPEPCPTATNALDAQTASYTFEPGYSYDDWEAFLAVRDHITNGTALPPGITLLTIGPKIQVSKTGVKVNSYRQILVTALEDTSSDLELAELWIDNQLVFTASRSNGSIVDNQDGSSLASLTALVDPCATTSGELKLFDGALVEQTSAYLNVTPW